MKNRLINSNNGFIICCTMIAIFYFSPNTLAQTSIKQINIGESVPDINVPVIINYKTSSARLSDFKGKLLILDYWSIWCGGCIEALPKLDQLQQQFKSDIVILPVAFTRPRKDVEAFYKKMADNERMVHLPSAVYQTMKNELMTMFPAYGFPMEVWIGKDGKLLAITDSFYITAENIQKALTYGKLDLPLAGAYISKKKPQDEIKSTIDNTDKTLMLSRLMSYSDTIAKNKSHRFKAVNKNGFISLTYYNTSVVDLIKASTFGTMSGHMLNDLVAVEIPDSVHLFYPKTDTNFVGNLSSHTFSYELRIPSAFGIENALSKMNEEVCRYFEINSGIEKRSRLCYILQRISPTYNLSTKAKKTKMIYDRISGNMQLDSLKMSDFISMISSKEMSPIIDETGYSGNIDITYSMPKEYNLQNINLELRKQNLVIKQEKRDLDVLVITKKRYPDN